MANNHPRVACLLAVKIRKALLRCIPRRLNRFTMHGAEARHDIYLIASSEKVFTFGSAVGH